MYSFKDIMTKNIRHTRGKFAGWTKPTGFLNARYAIFQNPSGDVLVPEYCLTAETKEAISKTETASQ